MLKPTNTALHYKMYKSGKSWVFAGIISAGLLLAGGGTVAQADTIAPDPATPTKTAPDSAQPEEAKDTVLSKDPAPKPATPEKPANTLAPTTDPKPDDVTNPETKPKTPAEDTTPAVHKPAVPEAPTPNAATPEVKPAPQPQSNESNQLTTPAQKTVAAIAPLDAPINDSIDTWMPNKTLQGMVAKALGKDVSQITQKDLAGLTRLASGHTLGDTVYIDGKTPFSLEGLQYATNLTSLDLSYDPGTEYLRLQMAPNGSGDLGDITDLSPLSALTKLTTLNVANNKIVSLAPLADLKALTNLDVTYNRIGDFSMLDAKQFSSLKFGHQVFVVDYAQQKYVDPTTHAITITQPMRLPQNYSGKLHLPFMGFNGINGFDLKEIKLQQVHLPSGDGHMVFLLYASGNDSLHYTLNTDDSLSFTNITPQSTYYYGNSYNLYANSVGTPTPGDHKYYLRADLQGNLGDSFTVLIPYANATAAAPVTVQYRDKADSATAIKQDLTIGTDKMAGDAYTLTPDQLAVDGYTYDDAANQNAAITGTLSDQAQTITLYYTKDATKPVTPVTPPVTPATTVTVTVHYQDGQGAQLLPDAQLTGQPGTTYQVKTPVLQGYQLDSASNPTGTFGSSNQDVMVTYHKLASGGDGATITPGTDSTKKQPNKAKLNQAKPAQPQKVNNQGQAATVTATNKQPQRLTATAPAKVAGKTTANSVDLAAPTAATKQTLPQTNEHRTSPLVGLALLLGTIIGFTVRRKRN